MRLEQASVPHPPPPHALSVDTSSVKGGDGFGTRVGYLQRPGNDEGIRPGSKPGEQPKENGRHWYRPQAMQHPEAGQHGPRRRL